MFRVKNIFIILVVNAFLFCAFTMVSEFLNLGYTMTQLADTVDVCADSAAQTAMLSEEFFGASSGDVYSEAQSLGSVVYYSTEEGVWLRANPFVLARYYDENGKFPTSQTDIHNLVTTDTHGIYGDYGAVGLFDYFYSDPSDALLTSGTPSLPTVSEWISGTAPVAIPEANSAFRDFVKAVSYDGVTTRRGIDVPSDSRGMASLTNVYRMRGSSIEVVSAYVSPLARMGLKTLDVNTSTGRYLNYEFLSPLHSTSGSSVYMLTPSSLGVTYIEPRVYKSTFIANLDQQVRLNKVRVTPVSERLAAYSEASGCISTSVYERSGVVDSTPLSHIDNTNNHFITSSSSIVNDGLVEYDMDSVQVRVQYSVVDVTDDANKHLVEQVAGVPAGYTTGSSLGDAFINTDTATDNISVFERRRVIARVTTKLKVYIPLRSPLLQWFMKDDTSEDNHFSIPSVLVDSSGGVTVDSDGLWYEHIQYVGILR